MPNESPLILSVTSQTFQTAVVDRSHQVPVVVDFWSASCQPCMQLAPKLEARVQQANGNVILAKVNVQEELELASIFRVQSIPYLVVIDQGQPISELRGLVSDMELDQWFTEFLPSELEQKFQRAMSLEQSDPEQSEQLYRELLSESPDESIIKIGLARTLLHRDELNEAASLLAELESRGFLEAEAEVLKGELSIRSAASEAGGVGTAREKVQGEPDNLEAKLALADALAAQSEFEEACEICLDLFSQDKGPTGQTAKVTLLRILDMMESQQRETATFRRQLANLMY